MSGTRFFCKRYAEKICMGVGSAAVADMDNSFSGHMSSDDWKDKKYGSLPPVGLM